jgi:hypothetical protein
VPDGLARLKGDRLKKRFIGFISRIMIKKDQNKKIPHSDAEGQGEQSHRLVGVGSTSAPQALGYPILKNQISLPFIGVKSEDLNPHGGERKSRHGRGGRFDF